MYQNIYDPTQQQNSMVPSIPGMSDTAQSAAVAGAGNAPVNTGIGLGTPDVGAANINIPQGGAGNPGFFGKGGMAQVGLGAIQTLGSLWNSFQQNKIAKKSLKLQERTFETNLANQKKTYNTELEDRIRNRYQGAGKGLDSKEADSYIEKNKL